MTSSYYVCSAIYVCTLHLPLQEPSPRPGQMLLLQLSPFSVPDFLPHGQLNGTHPMRLCLPLKSQLSIKNDAEAKYAMQTGSRQCVSWSYYRVMMSAKPSTHCPQEPETPAMLYPRGGIRVCLFTVQSTDLHGQFHGAGSRDVPRSTVWITKNTRSSA